MATRSCPLWPRDGLVFLLAMSALRCVPDWSERLSLVTGPRILAVQSEPPEAAPGATVSYKVLAVDAQGASAEPSVQWSFCATPKSPAENNAVAAACVSQPQRSFSAEGATVEAPLPADGCALFGPEPPPGNYRPRDPDGTGGYYQPVRATWSGFLAFGATRLLCNLPQAPLDVAVAYRSTYLPNRNPAVPTVTVMSGPTPSLPDASSPTGGAATLVEGIAPGSALAFRVAWPDSSKESFVAFDPGTQSLGTQTEDLRVSYFGTGGSWAHDHLGRRGDDGVHFVDNTWTAPREPGRFFLWFVLRDSRGGVSFAQVTIQLTP